MQAVRPLPVGPDLRSACAERYAVITWRARPGRVGALPRVVRLLPPGPIMLSASSASSGQTLGPTTIALSLTGGTAALARAVARLHQRGVDVRSLSYDGEGDGDGSYELRVGVGPGDDVHRLAAQLSRNVDVRGVRVEPAGALESPQSLPGSARR